MPHVSVSSTLLLAEAGRALISTIHCEFTNTSWFCVKQIYVSFCVQNDNFYLLVLVAVFLAPYQVSHVTLETALCLTFNALPRNSESGITLSS